jgi:hypothetical protein
MVSLMGDSRVAFLVWFIVVAIVVAAILIFVEIRLKKKKLLDSQKKQMKTPIDKMNIFLNKDVDVREKLDMIGKTAKDYFKEEYGLSKNLDYGELAKEFEKQKKGLEVKFCGEMFEAYYSNHKLTDVSIKSLGDTLIDISRKKKVAEDLSKVPGFWDSIDSKLKSVKDHVFKKVENHVSVQNEKLERKSRIKEREEHEMLLWARKAIRMGHSEEKVSSLLNNNGKLNKDEIRRILEVYRKELKISEKESVAVNENLGVAQGIIQKEKDSVIKKVKNHVSIQHEKLDLSSRVKERKKDPVVKKVENHVSVQHEKLDLSSRVKERKKDPVVKKVENHVSVQHEKLDLSSIVNQKEGDDLLIWVQKAIRKGYSEEKISGLLDNGKLDKEEIQHILEVYRKEAGVFKKEPEVSGNSLGIAQRIVQKEKDRLRSAEVYVR